MKLLLTNEEIHKKIDEFAIRLVEKYGEKLNNLVVVNVLQGGSWFTMNLVPKLDNKYIMVIDIRAKSYKGTEATGQVQISNAPDRKLIDGKDVLVTDDILDTGATANAIRAYFEENYSAKSIDFAFLVQRSSDPNANHESAACVLGDQYVIGFGFDYNGHFRSLKDIYALEDSDIKEFAD